MPIAEIIVGPASNQKNIYKSLVYKLEHSFVENVKIEIPSKEKMKEREKRYKEIFNRMKSQYRLENANLEDSILEDIINEKIHFCKKWGLIIRTSESSYIF